MSAINIEQSWQNILSITHIMEQHASTQHWIAVAQQATQRHHIIQQHFKQFPVGPNTAEFYQQHLSQFLQKEASLQQLADSAKKQVLKQNLTIINNKKAAGAYQVSSEL